MGCGGAGAKGTDGVDFGLRLPICAAAVCPAGFDRAGWTARHVHGVHPGADRGHLCAAVFAVAGVLHRKVGALRPGAGGGDAVRPFAAVHLQLGTFGRLRAADGSGFRLCPVGLEQQPGAGAGHPAGQAALRLDYVWADSGIYRLCQPVDGGAGV